MPGTEQENESAVPQLVRSSLMFRYVAVAGLIGVAVIARAEPPKEREDKKPDHVEITIKLYFNPPKEVGPKSRVDVRTISATLLKPTFPEVLLSNIEVMSLDRSEEKATLRIEKKDEATMRK